MKDIFEKARKVAREMPQSDRDRIKEVSDAFERASVSDLEDMFVEAVIVTVSSFPFLKKRIVMKPEISFVLSES